MTTFKKLLTTEREVFESEIDLLMGACNGLALLNHLAEFQRGLDSTNARNTHPITKLVLYKLLSLAGKEYLDLYEEAYRELNELNSLS